jgi:hypothetical protein
MNPCAEPRKFEMADSLRRGVRGCHGIGPVTARLSQRENTGIIEKIAESVVPSSGVLMDALRLKPSGKLDRGRLLYVRGAEYFRRARRGGSSFRELGRLVMSLRSLYLSLVRESRMDKLVADVETMFSAIADSIDNGQLSKLES